MFFWKNKGFCGLGSLAWCALALMVGPLYAQPAPALLMPELPEAMQTNLRAHFQILAQPCEVSRVRLQRLLPQALTDAHAALRALGYYQARVDLQIEVQDACWALVAQIEPGDPVLLEEVVVSLPASAETIAVFADLLADSVLRRGAILQHNDYEAFKSALGTRAVEEGYFDARFETAQIEVDLVDNRAEISLVFVPGTRYRFGSIDLEQDGRLSDSLISGLLPVHQGDPYSSSSLALLRKKLDESLYFRQIRVAPRLGRNPESEVPVSISLELRPRHAWNGGLGFTTDTGPRARAGYQNRYVNMQGHKATADATISAVRSSVDGSYTIPLQDAARQSLNFGLGYGYENNDSFQSKRTKFESSIRNENDSGWQQSLFVDIQSDSYIVGQQEDVSFLSMLGLSMSKTRADDLITTSSGWKLFAQLRGASDALLSDASFIQGYASAKHILSIGRSRLITMAEGGITWIDQTRSLPASLRYFAGGDQSLRGYDFRSLGPLDSSGAVAGGRHLLVVSMEYDFQVRQNWRAAVFTDAGNAFDNIGTLQFQQSVGVGIRWISPIGPVRLDIAHPLDAQGGFRLHITMGPDL